MEDASGEFRIIMSRRQDSLSTKSSAPPPSSLLHLSLSKKVAPELPPPAPSCFDAKQRFVPVVSAASSCSASFTLSKGNVYKAISGVAFQSADAAACKATTDKWRPLSSPDARGERRRTTRNERKENKRERRLSYAEPRTRLLDGPPPAAGGEAREGNKAETRRSRSLTSVDSAQCCADLSKVASARPDATDSSTYSSKAVFMHPFAPVVMHGQASGRKSQIRKSRHVREKCQRENRRSHSQVRVAPKGPAADDAAKRQQREEPSPPVRPRRARSASRSRKTSPLSPACPSLLFSFADPKDAGLSRNASEPHFDDLVEPSLSEALDEPSGAKGLRSSLGAEKEGIDFSVSETDWRKYDALVTRQLDTLLLKKEEAEGGYFSLERDETDELERCSDGDYFQRDNSNESIYVSQALAKDDEDDDVILSRSPDGMANAPPSEKREYTVEETYCEVPFANQRQEVGFVDDEGLYEEIFFDKTNIQNFKSSHQSAAKIAPLNGMVAPSWQSANDKPSFKNANDKLNLNKVKKSSSSTTVVYIGGGGGDAAPFDTPMTPSAHLLKPSASCNNLLHSKWNWHPREKQLFVNDVATTQENPSKIFPSHHRSTFSPRCACSSGPPGCTFAHTASCIQSRLGIGKLALPPTAAAEAGEDQTTESKTRRQTHRRVESDSVERTRSSSIHSALPTRHNGELDGDDRFGDIDFDMFAPKPPPPLTNECVPSFCTRHNMRSLSPLRLNSVSRICSRVGTSRDSYNASSSCASRRLCDDATGDQLAIASSFGSDDDVCRALNATPATAPSFRPTTFASVLQDAIFNPPDTVSSADDGDDSAGHDARRGARIANSSSSSDSSDDDEDARSRWLEADNEFDFKCFDAPLGGKPPRRQRKQKAVGLPMLPRRLLVCPLSNPVSDRLPSGLVSIRPPSIPVPVRRVFGASAEVQSEKTRHRRSSPPPPLQREGEPCSRSASPRRPLRRRRDVRS